MSLIKIRSNKNSNIKDLDPLRCTFINCPDPVYASTQDYGMKFMPVWLYTLASHIPDDGRFQLKMFDLQVESFEKISKADVFMFSGKNQDLDNLLKIQSLLKKKFPKAISMIGGPIAWSADQAEELSKLEKFDHICVGDGEEMIVKILESIQENQVLPDVIRAEKRFELAKATPMNRELLGSTISRYYGGIVEVSRGCPFLCEFCDIRTLEDNNRSHLISPDLIIKELDFLAKKEVTQITFACDNFIGDQNWAMEVTDKIIKWQDKTGFHMNFYTWLTIDVYKHKLLLEKMRKAGFDLLFIGIESFDTNSLLETAKVQNSSVELVDAVKTIQSYGFIVVAGSIFGFDSDTEDFGKIALKGMSESGLISGDPNWLTALPGTPLHRRMKLSGRLRESFATHGGIKYSTNIRYLLPKNTLLDSFRYFITNYLDGEYQYNRLKTYFDTINEGENYIPVTGNGFGNLILFLRMSLSDKRALSQIFLRLRLFLSKPRNISYLLKGLKLGLSHRHIKGWFGYVQFWLFAWTNAMFKYQRLDNDVFDIESVPEDFDLNNILPKGYEETADEKIPKEKTLAQLLVTTTQLKKVIERKKNGKNNKKIVWKENGENF
jgi:radical SAM superfamily enzyme YgiQ (UPF0313 family)|tara:strand:- start:7237 stop:9054 length:1818 start_codon:yes stop_codon:yes gene_type:complete